MGSKVPEKYFQLNAAFQQLRTVLGRLGIKHIDVEGLLTGDPISCIHVIQMIFFSPVRSLLANDFLVKYGLAQSNSDYKLVDTVFRIARTDFSLTPRLSVEQFLNGGSFTVRRLELLTEIAIAISKRCTVKPDSQPDCLEHNINGSVLFEPKAVRPVVVEEDGESVPPKPVCIDGAKKDVTENFLHVTKSLHSAVKELEEKVCSSIESLDARLCIVEGRLRILDKLQQPHQAHLYRDT